MNPPRQSLFKPAALLLLSLFAFAVCRAGDAGDPQLSPKQWRDDLQFFARELPKRHMDAFHFISREKFEAEVAELDHKLDSMDFDHMFVALRVIASSIGDGHTGINLPESAPPLQFPISVVNFNDDYRVTGVAPGSERALGAHLLKIADTPVKRAAEPLFTTTPQDEFPWYGMNIVNSFLANARMLHGLDVIPNHDTAQYTLADDGGKEFTIDVHSLAAAEYAKVQLAHPYKEGPLSTQKPAENFWFTYLPASRTVYCDVRAIRDLSGPAKSLMTYLKDHEKEVDKLVIDLRQNSGGDYNEGLHHLVEPLRDNPHINQKGHLFILIGPRTFSAAMSNATHFRYRTNAMLVGTPIGEKPNSFAERSQMTLPNSKMVVTYSVKFYKFVESGENIVRPDQEVNTTWEDFVAGRDPALEWILNYALK
jgi:hypothetical protein